ncbi:mucin-1-like [Zingiber officinale]|uniref:mucin-1-like n=1 Tax=Zingiber officinale TaxID=94328 RepID=UPI001C4D6C33|nr:mucin-1-like [Zingiber officinale]
MAWPTPSTQSPLVSPPRAPSIPGQGLGERLMGLGGRSGNVPFASPAFREASQAAHRARATNERLSQNVPTSSRRRTRSSSDDSDSDDQPLSQRRRCRAPRPMSNPAPSSIPSPPPNAAASPTSLQATPLSIRGNVADPPASFNNQAEPPVAHPATSQNTQEDEVGPSERPSIIPPAVPPQGPSLAPSGATAEPSAPPNSAADRCSHQLPKDKRPTNHYMGRKPAAYEFLAFPGPDGPICRVIYKDTSYMSQAYEESLIMNHSFHVTHHQNKMLRDRVTELELQLNDPTQASHALRTEIKALTSRKNSLEVSLALTEHELEELQEKQSQADNVHRQSMNQQALDHQRAMDQLAQKLRTTKTLARATTEGVSTALALYREGENDRYLQNRAMYLRFKVPSTS